MNVMVRKEQASSTLQSLAIWLNAVAGLPQQARGSQLHAHFTNTIGRFIILCHLPFEIISKVFNKVEVWILCRPLEDYNWAFFLICLKSLSYLKVMLFVL